MQKDSWNVYTICFCCRTETTNANNSTKPKVISSVDKMLAAWALPFDAILATICSAQYQIHYTQRIPFQFNSIKYHIIQQLRFNWISYEQSGKKTNETSLKRPNREHSINESRMAHPLNILILLAKKLALWLNITFYYAYRVVKIIFVSQSTWDLWSHLIIFLCAFDIFASSKTCALCKHMCQCLVSATKYSYMFSVCNFVEMVCSHGYLVFGSA